MIDFKKMHIALNRAIGDAVSAECDVVKIPLATAVDMYKSIRDELKIVRCKDCEYNSGNCHGLYAQFITCYKTGSPHTENWFCADGERK